MKTASKYIKQSLKSLYDNREVQQFVFLIFEHICNASRTEILLQEKQLTENQRNKVVIIVDELKQFRPIQYILGYTYFYDLRFELLDGVFIPRPETEELVDRIISDNTIEKPKILDICGGSGCISVTLANQIKNAQVETIEINLVAVKVIRRNAKLNNVNVKPYESDFLNRDDIADYQNKKYDIIVSNPPYVMESERQEMEPTIMDYEPHNAIFVPDNNPLIFYDKIAEFAATHLNKNGKLYFEINENLPKETQKVVEQHGFKTQVLKDINGKCRILTSTQI